MFSTQPGAEAAYKDQNYISSFEKAPEAEKKEVAEATLGSVTPSSERPQPSSPTSNDDEQTVYGGTGSWPWPKAKEKSPEKDLSPISKSAWQPNLPDVLQPAGVLRTGDSSVAQKDKEIDTLPTSSENSLEPGGIAAWDAPKDMAKERSGTMSPISSKEDA